MRVRAKEGAPPSEPSPAVPLEPAVSPPVAATETRPGQTTRRQFLTYGAVGLATATATGAGSAPHRTVDHLAVGRRLRVADTGAGHLPAQGLIFISQDIITELRQSMGSGP